MGRCPVVVRAWPHHQSLAVGAAEEEITFVGVSAELMCEHGPRPWSADKVELVLARYRGEGLEGAEQFYKTERDFADNKGVQRRIAAAAKIRCP